MMATETNYERYARLKHENELDASTIMSWLVHERDIHPDELATVLGKTFMNRLEIYADKARQMDAAWDEWFHEQFSNNVTTDERR